MKLRLLSILFLLVAPLAACDNSPKSSASPDSVQSSVPPASPSPILQSPIPSASPSSILQSPVPSASPNVATSPSATAASNNWYSYASSEGNYSVQFPAKPEEQPKATQSPQGQVSGVEVRYLDQAQQRIYLTRHLTLPVPPGTKLDKANVEAVLDNAQASAVQSSGAKLKDGKKISQSGYSGRQFTMSLPDGTTAKARIFINPNNLKAYQALVAAKNGQVDFPEANTFLESLTIKQ